MLKRFLFCAAVVAILVAVECCAAPEPNVLNFWGEVERLCPGAREIENNAGRNGFKEYLDAKDAATGLTRRRPANNAYKAQDAASFAKFFIDFKAVADSIATWRARAEQGNADAQCFLGISYDEGQGVPQDYTEAAKWYRKAAEQGHAMAQCFLGIYYDAGRGVPQNYTEAIKWYCKAAEQVNSSPDNHMCFKAQYNLGLCYALGKGVIANKVVAATWWRKAAEQGHAEAQYNLGIYYSTGEGVLEDVVEAYKWLLLAGAAGSDQASAARVNLARKMTPEQIAEAQRKSKEFLEGNRENAEQPRRKTVLNCKASGTGYFITPNGFILTASHVISAASRVEVRTKSGDLEAKVIHADPANDIAVLKVEGSFPAVPLENSKTVKLGDAVITIGFPNIQIQGFSPKLTKGEISSLFGIRDDPRHFQVSAPIQPGNSGGPLLNASGNVIGTLVSRLSDSKTYGLTGMLPQNVNYALKSSYALAMIEALPEVSDKLLKPVQGARKTEEIVRATEDAIVMILVY